MKVFHCDHCQNLVFFENTTCLACGHALAFLPDVSDLGSLEQVSDGLWRSAQLLGGREYRLCENYSTQNVCNWAVPAAEESPLCASCRLTSVIPDLSEADNQVAWYRLETAKRRLIYSLMALRLPVHSREEDPERGLAFEFLADRPDRNEDEGPVLTGHANGVITINIAEANDAEREKRRLALHEPYRTLIGHFRHEVGHYYWDRLVRDSDRLESFRERFGDEQADYGQALEEHYQRGATNDWQERFISAYAAAHPWEDWAESWAHYLHMADTLETAAATGLALRPQRRDEPKLKASSKPLTEFDEMIDRWVALTYVLNHLNRGLGLPDGYPFVLSTTVIEKLRFVHETIGSAGMPVASTGTTSTATLSAD